MTESARPEAQVPPAGAGTDAGTAPGVVSLDAQLCFAVHAASRAFDGVYRVILRDTGLTYPQFLVVLVLLEHGELSVKQLGEKLRLDSGTLSPLLKRLEAAGLVRRRRSEADERSVTVELTEAGGRLRAVVCEIPMHTAASTGMALADVVALRAQLAHLTASLDAAAKRYAEHQPLQSVQEVDSARA